MVVSPVKTEEYTMEKFVPQLTLPTVTKTAKAKTSRTKPPRPHKSPAPKKLEGIAWYQSAYARLGIDVTYGYPFGHPKCNIFVLDPNYEVDTTFRTPGSSERKSQPVEYVQKDGELTDEQILGIFRVPGCSEQLIDPRPLPVPFEHHTA